MTKRMFAATLLGGALAFALLPTGSSADELLGPPSDDDLAVFSNEVSAAELAAQSGGTDIDDVSINYAYTNQQLTGEVSGNVNTGLIRNNNVTGNRGITSTMYNTGNNVSFSSNIQLNINMH